MTITQHDLDTKDEIVIPPGETTLNELLFITRKSQRIVGSGRNSTIRIAGEGGFWLRGCTDLTLQSFRMVGPGKGNAIASGHYDVNGVYAMDLWFEEVGLGISFNAYEGGSFNHGVLENIHVKNIRGTSSGTGYGVHVAEAYDVAIDGVFADNCERHDLYLASSKRPSHIKATHIRSINHRCDVANDSYRAAISIARNNGIELDDVVVRDFYDCALDVAQVTEEGGPGNSSDTRDITIRNFTAYNRKNVPAMIRVGEEYPVLPTDTFKQHLSNVFFKNICLVEEAGAGRVEPLNILNGQHVVIDGFRAVTQARSALVFADQRFSNADNTTDLVLGDAFSVRAPVSYVDNPAFRILEL